MYKELKGFYNDLASVRKKTLDDFITVKNEYIRNKGKDEFIIKLYDEQIYLAQKSIESAERLSTK